MNKQDRQALLARNKQEKAALKASVGVQDDALVCPHCQTRGYVHTKRVLWETFATCSNCRGPHWSLTKRRR